jgi:hypothetical protein
MGKITVIATFRIEDNGISEEILKDNLMCESFRGLKIMPDDAELYQEDPIYREKVAEYNKIKKEKEEYLKIKLQENQK